MEGMCRGRYEIKRRMNKMRLTGRSEKKGLGSVTSNPLKKAEDEEDSSTSSNCQQTNVIRLLDPYEIAIVQ